MVRRDKWFLDGWMDGAGRVGQAFQPAGSGDFPVARSGNTGLESPVNPQAGMPALQLAAQTGSLLYRRLATGRHGWPDGFGVRWQDTALKYATCRVAGKRGHVSAGQSSAPLQEFINFE